MAAWKFPMDAANVLRPVSALDSALDIVASEAASPREDRRASHSPNPASDVPTFRATPRAKAVGKPGSTAPKLRPKLNDIRDGAREAAE